MTGRLCRGHRPPAPGSCLVCSSAVGDGLPNARPAGRRGANCAGLLGIGFPVALALAWVFDVGPEGVARTEALDAGCSPTR